MYKVLVDGALMCDSRIEELALSNPVVKLEEGKVGSFSFIIPPDHPMIDVVKRRKSIIKVVEDDEILFCGICIEVTEDFYKQKTIYCESELTYLNDTIQRPCRYAGMTVRELSEAYVSKHNSQTDESKHFSVGMVTVEDENDYISCYTNMESTMACIKADLIDDLGGFLQVRYEDGVRYLDYLADSLNTNKQTIKLGKNLIDYVSNIDSADIATAIIPLGAKLAESSIAGLEERLTIKSVNDGLDYVFNQDAVNSYGWIYKTVTWDDVTTPEALKAKAEKYLAEVQFENVVIEAKALDLHFEDDSVEKFKISDKIRVVSAPHGLNKYFRLTKLTRNLNNPEKDTITLGKDERLSLTAKSTKENIVIKQEIEKSSNSTKQQAIANATALIANAMGGFVVKTNDEILIMDTDNIETATKVWRWNINGLGYSSNGYAGPYELAMTMDGAIVADMITTGILNADLIRAGILQSKDGSSSWNLETGNMHLEGEFTQTTDDGHPSVEIKNNQIKLYDWTNTFALLGGLNSLYYKSSDRSGVSLWGTNKDRVSLSIKDENETYYPVIMVDGKTHETEPPWIKNTANGTIFPNYPGGGITVKNGLITDWNMDSLSGDISIVNATSSGKTLTLTIEHGMIADVKYS